jgi:galactonate dehydratase
MVIKRIETIQAPENPHFIWVRVHTDTGLIGLGETYQQEDAVRELLTGRFARTYVLGRDAFGIERAWHSMYEIANYCGWAGAEMRAMSALNIALWDIVGQATGQPVHTFFGGAFRDSISVYNTCGAWHDLDFMEDAGAYASALYDRGIRGMKIWPFDRYARENGGHFISAVDLEEALEPVRAVRAAVGNRMSLAIEMHGHWDLQCAVRIARALEPFDVMWLEDPMKTDSVEGYARLAEAVSQPLAVSERLQTRNQYLPILQRGAARVVIADVEWCGGLSEAHRIATLAESFQVPIAFHHYGGPVLNFASAHMAAAVPNLMIMEVGLDLVERWSSGIVTNPFVVTDGRVEVPTRPGIGTALAPEFLSRTDLQRAVCE